MIDAATLTDMIEAALARHPDPEVSDEAIAHGLAALHGRPTAAA